jgi:hypothetical protein
MLLVTWLPRLLRSKIAESIIISSPQHPAYVDQFLTNWPQHEDQEHQVPLKYNKFTFYHLENRDAFLDGARPIFSPRGPFVFREFYRHQNVSFSADGSQVSYADSIINRFVPELSNGSLADRITLLNLPYIKIASRYGRTESQLLESLAVLAVPKIIKRLEERMVPSIKAAASAKAIQRAIRTFWPLNGLTVDGLLSRMGGDCPLSANQCSVIRVPATKYRVLVDTRVCGEASMGEKCRAEGKSISLPQMKALFNSSDPLSLLSGDDGAVIWLTTNQQQHNRLSAHFNISLSQVSLLHLWMKRGTFHRHIFLHRR